MARCFLHIGVPKTGTTFLQGVLWQHRDLSRRHGLVLPLAGAGDHYRASLDLTARADRARSPERVAGSWRRLVDAAERYGEEPEAGLRLIRELRAARSMIPVVYYHGQFDSTLRSKRSDAARAAGALGEAVYPSELLELITRVLAQ